MKSLFIKIVLWFTGLQIGYIKRSDFFHKFKDKGRKWNNTTKENEPSWYVGYSFLRGAGYCHWLFGRKWSLPGFSIKIGHNLFRYEYNENGCLTGRKIYRKFVFSIYRNPNTTWMTCGN